MSEPFKFSFSGDDIEDDEEIVAQGQQQQQQQQQQEYSAIATKEKKDDGRPAKYHSLDDMINLLPPHISYSPHTVRGTSNISIWRRELFDVKMQLMTESKPQQPQQQTEGDEEDEETKILLDSSEDIKRGIYEGGLKSWECAEDLVSLLSSSQEEDIAGQEGGGRNVMEVGCGTALPSCYLLGSLLRKRLKENNKEDGKTQEGWGKVRLYMADYNISVLRLVTLPNLILAYLQALSATSPSPSQEVEKKPEDNEGNKEKEQGAIEEEEAETSIDLSASLLEEFTSTLSSLNIDISFISGSWSSTFAEFLNGGEKSDLILAAETLYQPDNLQSFTDVLKACLKSDGKALISTKKVYFGVGGGVKEFEAVLRKQEKDGEEGKKLTWSVVGDGGSEGVGRCIGEVKWI